MIKFDVRKTFLELIGCVRGSMLALMYLNPEREFYLSEMAKILGHSNPGILHRDIVKLLKLELVQARRSGRRVYYSANMRSSIFSEIRSIAVKSSGILQRIRECLHNHNENIDFAYVYGSFATGEAGPSSDVDLIVVGSVDQLKLMKSVSDIESSIGRTISLSVFDRSDYVARLSTSFLNRVHNGEKIVLIGSDDELRKMD
ncbi:MAG: nucleotidyltransferase domain-containing protein [Candidatus Aegiribacteria sp.]|nr:nucleotidyltransferase domain-containing protein [Candidatus Aegiribacteria sp.]